MKRLWLGQSLSVCAHDEQSARSHLLPARLPLSSNWHVVMARFEHPDDVHLSLSPPRLQMKTVTPFALTASTRALLVSP